MQRFIPQDGREYYKILILLFTILIAFILILALCGRSIVLFFVALLLTIVCIFLLRCISKFGLYIDNEKLTFKRFFKRQIATEDVSGLLILKSQIKTRYTTSYIKNKNGKFQYSIIYLKEVRPEFADYDRGNLDFLFSNKEYAYFYTVYDERIIELFKGKVPIITCIWV